LNGCGSVVRACRGSTGEAWPFDAPVSGFNVVTANLIARAIVDMAPDFSQALAADGTLVASGIIGEREEETRASLESAGLRITSVRAMGDWRCIEATGA
jgi:ribosomal protein L11 methylase PrmA